MHKAPHHSKTHVKSLHHPSHHGMIHHKGHKGGSLVATPANVGKLAGHPGKEIHPAAKSHSRFGAS